MSNRESTRLSAVAAAITLLLAGGAAFGASAAGAVPVAGSDDAPGVNRSAATDTLKIQLSQGNPDDDGQAPTGSVQGVTIHLDRLAGIDPKNPSDKRRVENANSDQINAWEKDLHVSGVTDANGVVYFKGLADGIYVVSSTAPNDSYREINSFLVAVPFYTVTNDPTPVPGVIVAKSHNPGTPPETPPTTPPTMPPTVPPTTPPTVPSKPPKTTPGVPPTTPDKPTPSTPGEPTPPEPGNPSQTPGSPGGKSSGPLAITGVQAAGLAVIAAVLIGSGFVIISVNKNRRDKKAKG